MPVKKCSNGKYRIGDGKCMYKSKASADRAYKGYLGSKYMTKKISEKVDLKANENEDENSKMHSSDLTNIMRLAGIEKDVQSGDKDSVDFIGALSKGQVNEKRFETFKMLEAELSKLDDDKSLSVMQYNIGDEVETPFGHGIVQDVCDDGKCLVKHTDPKDEYGDPVEVEMDSMHKISEANLGGNIQYFMVDQIGSDAIKNSKLANEIKYTDDDNVMAISSDRIDEINDIIAKAGGTLSIKEANEADPYGGAMFSPYEDEPTSAEMDIAYDMAKDEVEAYFNGPELTTLLSDLSGESKVPGRGLQTSEHDDRIDDFISDASHEINKSLEFNEMGQMLDDDSVIKLIKEKLTELNILPTAESMDLSKGSYDRAVIEMIADEMRTGKNPAEIAEELSFDESEVATVCETILNLKKK